MILLDIFSFYPILNGYCAKLFIITFFKYSFYVDLGLSYKTVYS